MDPLWRWPLGVSVTRVVVVVGHLKFGFKFHTILDMENGRGIQGPLLIDTCGSRKLAQFANKRERKKGQIGPVPGFLSLCFCPYVSI